MDETTAQIDTETKHHAKKVTVTVDSKPHHVEPGSYVVSAFKQLVHVDASRELDQVVDGAFIPLANDASIEIKGGEVFVSHVPQGGSS